MRLAQLYEGVEVKARNPGLTYCVRIPPESQTEADTAARLFVKETYGEKYVAQEARLKKKALRYRMPMAIRPTDITLTFTIVKESLQDLFRLYQLI